MYVSAIECGQGTSLRSRIKFPCESRLYVHRADLSLIQTVETPPVV